LFLIDILEVRKKLSESNESWVNSVDRRLDNLELRVSTLENILSQPAKMKKRVPSPKGPSQAIWTLINDHFLDTPKLVNEIQSELNRRSYYYSVQTIDSALRRMTRNDVLTRIGKKGQWKYVLKK